MDIQRINYAPFPFVTRSNLADKGIATEPVIGYVNDGTDDIMLGSATRRAIVSTFANCRRCSGSASARIFPATI
jgi:hypothetical protein